MLSKHEILQSFKANFKELKDRIVVINNSDEIKFENVDEGILIVYASWSGAAIVNCTQTLKALDAKNYHGQILVVDIDCMEPEFQINLLGKVCHGWGETFSICKGKITEK